MTDETTRLENALNRIEQIIDEPDEPPQNTQNNQQQNFQNQNQFNDLQQNFHNERTQYQNALLRQQDIIDQYEEQNRPLYTPSKIDYAGFNKKIDAYLQNRDKPNADVKETNYMKYIGYGFLITSIIVGASFTMNKKKTNDIQNDTLVNTRIAPSIEMVKKYHMYKNFFPTHSIAEFDSNWSYNECESRLAKIKSTICNNDNAGGNSSFIDNAIKKGVYVSFVGIEALLKNFLNCKGFADDVAKSEQILNVLKLMLVDNDLLTSMLSKIVKTSITENNPNLPITMAKLLFWTLMANIENNNNKRILSTDDLRKELDMLKE